MKKNSKKEIKDNTAQTQQINILNDVVDQIIEMYPELQPDKETIIQKIINKQELGNKSTTELVFDKIILDEQEYYKDKNGFLWNADANIVGVWESDTTYYLFAQVKNLSALIKTDFDNIDSLNL